MNNKLLILLVVIKFTHAPSQKEKAFLNAISSEKSSDKQKTFVKEESSDKEEGSDEDFFNEKKVKETIDFINSLQPKQLEDKPFNDEQRKFSEDVLNLSIESTKQLTQMIKDNKDSNLITAFKLHTLHIINDKQHIISIITMDQRTWPDTFAYLMKNNIEITNNYRKIRNLAQAYIDQKTRCAFIE